MRWGSPRWDQVAFAALDLETSGLTPRTDEILSLAWVPIRNGVVRYGEHVASHLRPPDLEHLSLAGLPAHELLPAELAAAPPFCDFLPRLDALLRSSVLVLHHAPLDLGFLRRAYQREGAAWPRPRVVDTVTLLRRLDRRHQLLRPHPQPLPLALGDARAILGLPPYPAHQALADALATAELFLVLRGRLAITRLRGLLD
jgi:DNA polymerase-3 subunit epsilon